MKSWKIERLRRQARIKRNKMFKSAITDLSSALIKDLQKSTSILQFMKGESDES